MGYSLACATDMTLFGYDQGVVSPLDPSKTKILSTVTAIYDVGCFFGAMLAFTAGEGLGRKKTILLGCTIMAIGTILKVSSYIMPQMFVGRIVPGIGNGLSTVTAPVSQTETSQANWRGKLVILELGLNADGHCLVDWISYGLFFKDGWPLSHDRDDEALEVLACIDAMSPDDPYIRTQYDEIKYSIAYERENAIPWRSLLRINCDSTKTLRRLLLGASTQAIQQLQGINTMSYYLPTVLITSVGLTNSTARLLTACNATSYFIFFSCIAVTMIEPFGRRGLMLLSGSGQFVSFLVITVLLRFAETDTGEVYGTASVVLFLYHVAFGVGMLGGPWLYPTGINSLHMRTKGAAVATATNWIINFAIVEITPIGIQRIGWRFWVVWTVLNAVFLPVIYFLYSGTASPPLIVTRDPDAVSANRPLKHVQREDEVIQRRAKEAQSMGTKSDGASVEHVN
ncbi:hypothetical protein BDW71DRAFT_194610 [Aspergillus fruticulosus]